MVNAPVKYTSKFIQDPTGLFEDLRINLQWKRHEFTPRSEYYINRAGNFPYTYGKGVGIRTYMPSISIPSIDFIFGELFNSVRVHFDICFLNLYLNNRDQLGWHADDSPEIDDNKPIAVISLGTEREIWFCPNDDKTKIEKQKLESGSLLLMGAGMQETHLHRIPKASFLCGERISLTFRGFKQ
jgi:alkylated DNA repair dioxygenase AlkB